MNRMFQIIMGCSVVASCLIHVSCASTSDPKVWNQRQLTVIAALVQELEGRHLDPRKLPLKFGTADPDTLAAKTTVICDEQGIVLSCQAAVTGGQDNLGCWERTKKTDPKTGAETVTSTFKLCANGGKPIIQEKPKASPPE